MNQSTMFHVFTPQRDEPEELEKILVKRHALLDSAVGKIRESVITPDKHRLLFVGPRGMGKSYLVTLIHHRLSIQEDLAEKMRFAWLNEDQTSTTFLHLLMRIYRKLVDQYPSEFPVEELDAIRGKDPADAREILGQALIRHLKDRTVVLLIENLDAIFSAMNEVEQRTWRGFLQDHPHFAIVATAQGLTKDISSKTKPFFGFFDIHHLDPLTVDEAAELLEKIAALNDDQPLVDFIASPRGKARMRAIHHLSGGNPRLYLILSDFLTKDSLDNLVRLFEETVDRQLTPYFQERMRWLSPQQQEIVQYLCQQIHPSSVKVIAEGIFIKQNTVSGQLKQLREKGYLVSKGRGKESLYELAEPLMRLSFQVKEMNYRQPLTLIVDFMRVWYDRQDLEKRLERILPGTWGRDYFEVALHKIDTEGNAFRHSLMLTYIKDIDLNHCDARQLEELRGIAEETDSPDAWFTYARACMALEDYQETVSATLKHLSFKGVSNINTTLSYIFIATSKLRLGEIDESIENYTLAMDVPDVEEEVLAVIVYGRGNARMQKGDYVNAVLDLTSAINIWKNDIKNLADALILRGECNSNIGMEDIALSDLGVAVELAGLDQSTLVKALAKRAFLLSRLKRHSEALRDAERVINTPKADSTSLAQALNVRGVCRMYDKEFVEAKVDFDRICDMPKCHPMWLANAYFLRSGLSTHSNEIDRAITDLDMVIETYEPYAALASAHLSATYVKLKRYHDALKCIEHLFFDHIKYTSREEFSSMDIGGIMISAAFGLKDSSKGWMKLVGQILPQLSEWNAIAVLSTALVQHLDELKHSELNDAALDRWGLDWENVSQDFPQMQIGIRMLRAGLEWIKTKDDGALLDLVREEREIVRQALGLGEESDE